MTRLLTALIATLALAACATTPPESMRGEVEGAVKEWAAAVKSRNADRVAGLYAEDALLLAAFDQKPVQSRAQIRKYFKDFLDKERLNVTLDKEYVRLLDENSAVTSGLYTFNYMKGKRAIRVAGRYTFVLEKRPERGWVIVEHHSSQMPFKK